MNVQTNISQTQPIIPFTISGFVEVVCHICNFHQPLKNRPDVVSMAAGGNAGPGPFPPPANPGWSQQQPQGQAPARYG